MYYLILLFKINISRTPSHATRRNFFCGEKNVQYSTSTTIVGVKYYDYYYATFCPMTTIEHNNILHKPTILQNMVVPISNIV